MSARQLLYLVRHGATPWNAERRYQGQRDVPLSELGRRQAACLAARLRDVRFGAILSSDLARARETAEILAASGATPVEVDPDLREMDYGAWEGLTAQEAAARYPAAVHAYRADPVHAAPPGGESFACLQERALRACRALLARRPGRALVVSHGGTLKALAFGLLGLELRLRGRFQLDNGSLSILEVTGERARLLAWNETGHLAEGVGPGGRQGPPGSGV